MKRLSGDFAFMLVLLALAASLSVGLRYGSATPLRQDLAAFPTTIGDWQGTDLPPFDERTMSVLRVSDYLNRRYRRSDHQEASLYIGYYRAQRAGETMHSPKNCLPGSGWEVLENRRTQLQTADGRTLDVNLYTIQKDQSSSLVLYWYQAQGRSFASEYEGKAILVWQALRTGRTDGAMIRVIVPLSGQRGNAEAIASDLALQIHPLLKQYLPE